MTTLLMLLALLCQPAKSPLWVPPYCPPGASAIAAHVAAVLPSSTMTLTEAEAIDKRFWQANRYRLCPASCGMICAKHGSEWLLELGEADPSDPNQRPAEPTEIKPAENAPAGHYERRCGSGGCRQVWVADPPGQAAEAKPEAQEDSSSSLSSRFRLRRKR